MLLTKFFYGKMAFRVLNNLFCASFDHIDYIVAKFLAFVDDVDVHGAEGVGVLVVVDVEDVLCLETVAEGVYLVLNADGLIDGLSLASAP